MPLRILDDLICTMVSIGLHYDSPVLLFAPVYLKREYILSELLGGNEPHGSTSSWCGLGNAKTADPGLRFLVGVDPKLLWGASPLPPARGTDVFD